MEHDIIPAKTRVFSLCATNIMGQFESGFAVDHILKTIKWLFIEQDIRYWNYSGRYMTWGIVPEP